MYTAAVVTVSDRSSKGERPDGSGPLVASLLEEAGYQVTEQVIVPDSLLTIQDMLTSLADQKGVALIVTTGGKGFSPQDVTPEGTPALCPRPTPGLPEAKAQKAAIQADIEKILGIAK